MLTSDLIGIQSKQDKETPIPDDTLPSTSTSTPPSDVLPSPDPSKLLTALKQLNAHLTLIHASLPPRTALILFTGHSDPRVMSRLQARKAEFENALRSGGAGAGGVSGGVGLGVAGSTGASVTGTGSEPRWTAADARALEEAVELAKRGLLLLCIKGDAV
jgi:RNA exonuclease 1